MSCFMTVVLSIKLHDWFSVIVYNKISIIWNFFFFLMLFQIAF